MTFGISILLVIISCFVCLMAVARHQRLLALGLAVVVSVCGYNAYTSHKQALGAPVKMTWEEMPSKFTVNFFKIIGKRAIVLWLNPDQLVILPYISEAEDALEGERESMGNGQPSTFAEGEGSPGGREGEGGEGDGDGSGNGESGEGESGESGQGGWNYELKGRGNNAIPGGLPPK